MAAPGCSTTARWTAGSTPSPAGCPPCKYFCVTNLPLPEQQAQQDALLADGGVTYVVSRDGALDQRFGYRLMDQASYDGGEGMSTWYLYRVAD